MELMPGAAELAEAFARDGVVCVRSALDPVEVAAAAGADLDHPLFPIVWPANG